MPDGSPPSPGSAADRWYLRGRVVDGTGSPPFHGTVLIEGARIASVDRGVADMGDLPGRDVGGSVIAPGFVDLHTHSDVSLLSEPSCISAVGQGITTQVVGHCGFSAAPVSPTTVERMVEEEPVFGFPGVAWNWEAIPDYLDVVDQAAPATNVVTLVGHNTVRRLVMGGDAQPAGAEALAAMRRCLEDALDGGAIGVSTGLSYAPGMFADERELVGIAGAAAARGRRYHTHMRYGESSVRESLEEALRIAKGAEVALNVSHLYPYAWDAPDEVDRILELVDRANAEGGDVTFDLTVFPRGGGAWLQQLPGWAREGGLEGTVRRLKEPVIRRQLEQFLVAGNDPDYWDDALIVKINDPANESLVGRSIADIARDRGRPPESVALDLVVEDGQFWVAPHIKRPSDLDQLITHDTCVPITDGMAAHPIRHRSLGIMPKTFGSFAELLGGYVRERRVLRLEQAVEKLTRLPAQRADLGDRGVLARGKVADLVVFDPAIVSNRATEADPAALPAGIEQVIVAGAFTLQDGVVTGARPGRALRPASSQRTPEGRQRG